MSVKASAAPVKTSEKVPRVSMLVAMRNEEKYIEACLASLLAQTYPSTHLEILVMDGASDDASRAIVEKLFQGRPNCRLVRNDGITQAHGWNLGIRLASGDIIGIVSGHVQLAPDYVATAVETLRRTRADMVGGPARKVGGGRFGDAVAAATSSWFGVGGARFHYADREQEVDTVFMGVCPRATYERIGLFDVEMVRNQDDELSYRLRAAGGRIVCNPAIRSLYRNRTSWRGLARQYYQYGYWKIRVLEKHPRQMQTRHFVPAVLVAVTVGGALLSPLITWAGNITGIAIGSYVVANGVASILTARRHGWSRLAFLPMVFASLHFSYGLGFWRGLLGAAVARVKAK